MVNSYLLVNPSLKGKFNTSLKARNSKEAANMFYTNLSLYFNNSIPEFHFSLQKGLEGHGKYYHFKVQEKRKKNEVKFEIVPFSEFECVNHHQPPRQSTYVCNFEMAFSKMWRFSIFQR